jgi:hypothetical protein
MWRLIIGLKIITNESVPTGVHGLSAVSSCREDYMNKRKRKKNNGSITGRKQEIRESFKNRTDTGKEFSDRKETEFGREENRS